MPLYEYQCSKCGKVFEKIQKFSDAPLTEHEDCGGPVERLISAAGLHFKGSGFYITDYARSGGAGKGDSKSGEGSGAGAKSESTSTSTSTSTESKAAKTDSKPSSTPSTSSS